MLPLVFCRWMVKLMNRQAAFSSFLTCLLVIPNLDAGAATVHGVVTDSKREPLPNAVVRLEPNVPSPLFADEVLPVAETRTDREGRFSLELDTTASMALTASAKDKRTARFELTPEAMKRPLIGLALERGGNIAGRVTDPEGKPVVGAAIGPLMPSIDMSPADAQKLIRMWTSSDAEGKFRFEGLDNAADFHFTVQAPGLQITNVTAKPGAEDLKVKLVKGGSTVRGELDSRARKPADFAGTPVRINGNGFDVLVRADTQGRFRVEGLPKGEYSVESLPGPDRMGEVKTIVMPRDHDKTLVLEMSEGYVIEGTTVDFETSEPVGGVGLRVNGRDATSDPNGRFVIGSLMMRGSMDVEVLSASGFTAMDPTMTVESDGLHDVKDVVVRVQRLSELSVMLTGFEASTTTPARLTMLTRNDAARSISVTTTPVTVRVVGSKIMHLFATATDYASEVETATLTTSTNLSLDLSMAPPARLKGRVFMAPNAGNSQSSASLAGTRVELSASPEGMPLAQTVTGDDGSFDMPNQPTGALLVTAINAEGTQRVSAEVLLTAGETTLVELRLSAGLELSGMVTSQGDQPVRGATVRWYGKGATGVTESDAFGQFVLRNLASEKIDLVKGEMDGFLPGEAGPLTLPATGVKLILKKAPALRAQVEGATESIWSVHLVLMQPWGTGAYPEQLMGHTSEMRTISGGGVAEFSPREDGRYFVVAKGDGNQTLVGGPVAWKTAEATDVELKLKADQKSQMVVKGDSGSLNGAVITATNMTLPDNGSEGLEFSDTMKEGRAQLEGLPAGDYLVVAESAAGGASAVNVEVVPPSAAEATLAETTLSNLKGWVKSAGRGVAEADVTLLPQQEGGPTPRSVKSASDGSFEFDALSPNSYLVQASWKDGDKVLAGQLPVDVKRNEETPDSIIDVTPAESLKVAFPPEMKIAVGEKVSFTNLISRVVTEVKWSETGATAELTGGNYEIWRGDSVAGTSVVDNGKVSFEASGE